MIPQQRPDDLTLMVMHTAQCPLDLHILEARCVPVSDGVIEFRIIGESHWITVRRDGRVLHEVLACVPGTVRDAAVNQGFISDAPCSYATQGYAITVSCTPLSPVIAARERDGDSIEVAFPHPHGGDVLRFTRIWWQSACVVMECFPMLVCPCCNNVPPASCWSATSAPRRARPDPAARRYAVHLEGRARR